MKFVYKRICPILLLLALLFQSGCATPGKSAEAGALAGGLTGAGVGALADPGAGGQYRFRNVVIGTVVGAGVGTAAGFMLGEHAKNDRDEARAQGKADAIQEAQSHAAATSGTEPRLVPAKTEARWIPDHIQGSTFVPGHFEYRIIENAHWESSQ